MTDIGQKFVPSTIPFFDFLITRCDTPLLRRRMVGLGATRLVVGSVSVYTFGFSPAIGDKVLSGAVRHGSIIESGPKLLSRSDELLIGQCCIIEIGTRVLVRPDFFGMLPLYYDEIEVSNRLELVAEVKRVRGTFWTDTDVIRSQFIADNAFSMQIGTFRTPIGGVKLLPAEHSIEVGEVVAIRNHSVAAAPLSYCDYWDLIKQGAAEVITNVEAALNSFEIVEAAITAGRDSRVTLAALIALGRVRDVRFSTHPRDLDVPLGSALVKRFGGVYGIERRVEHWVERSLKERITRRRSFYFGQYHLARWGLFPQVFPQYADRAVQLTGGLGELYRAFYQKEGFTQPYLEEVASVDEFRNMFRERQWVSLLPGHLDHVAAIFQETFQELPGTTMGEKLGAHYLNFRNRMHFGLTSLHRQPETLIWNPLASPTLLRAARGMPPALMNSGRILFDVTQEMCEELAYLPYGSAIPNYSSMQYHRASRFDGTVLAMDCAPEIVRGPQRLGPKQPRPAPHDMEKIVRDSIIEFYDPDAYPSLTFLRESKAAARIKWIARQPDIRKADSLYSKLDAIVNCWIQ